MIFFCLHFNDQERKDDYDREKWGERTIKKSSVEILLPLRIPGEVLSFMKVVIITI